MITENVLMDELMAERPMLKPVLSRFNIQLIPSKSIKEFCIDKDIHCDFILSLFNSIGPVVLFQKGNFEQYNSEIILDYLIKSHSHYTYKSIPELEQNFDYLLRNFKSTNPYLLDIAPLFVKFRDGFIEHIQKEENQFFPYVMDIEQANELSIAEFNCDKVVELLQSYSTEKFLYQHDEIENLLSEIRLRLAHHSVMGKLSFVHNIFLGQIESLETDLKRHAVLEEEIILQRAVLIEKELWKKVTHFEMYNLSCINGGFI